MAKRIFVAGHNGMVGRAIVRKLALDPSNIIICRSRGELDLTNQKAVTDFFKSQDIDEIYLAAGKVGGIIANATYPAEFIYTNLVIAAHVIEAAHRADIQRLLFLGSSCIYPKHAPQPIKENDLMTGLLEPTNEPYAIAKIAGVELCAAYHQQFGRDYRCVMPTNLYGPYDRFSGENAHVIPALMQRLHEAKISGAKTVPIWGSGHARREFLFVDDMAAACVTVMGVGPKAYQKAVCSQAQFLNVGVGSDLSIGALAKAIAVAVGFKGDLVFDTNRPEGTPQKLLDITRMTKLGWRSETGLTDGLKQTYDWYLENMPD